ncbi:MAG: hypothetical protein CM15mP83_6960 [Flavobacteriaceae bacterium]|nr:MAG: hypothetical protein CM15mP83_6960 [Flavobacteriaceae bacterium]
MSPGNRAIFRLKYQITEQAASSGLVANQLKVNAKGLLTQTPSTFTEVSDLSEDQKTLQFDHFLIKTITLLHFYQQLNL